MSADPRCVVCRGAGTVQDAAGRDEICACTEHPKRDPYAQPSIGWASEAFADVLRKAEERMEHARTCTQCPCRRCERFLCACGKPFEGASNRRCNDCLMAEQRAKALETMRATVPKHFRWAFDAETDLEGLQRRVRADPELVRRAVANPRSTDILLEGDTKMGKTSLIVAMLDAWVRQAPELRADARFVESWWLVGARARHPLGQGEAPEVIEAVNASLLVIDDLGSETDDGRGVMQFVIFKRHNEDRPTWITTGFDAAQLMNKYGSQVIRRVVEHGIHVKLGGKAAA